MLLSNPRRTQVDQILGRDRKYLLSPDYRLVSLDAIKDNLRKLREDRWYRSIKKRILQVGIMMILEYKIQYYWTN